jgi:hypothetical protein
LEYSKDEGLIYFQIIKSYYPTKELFQVVKYPDISVPQL